MKVYNFEWVLKDFAGVENPQGVTASQVLFDLLSVPEENATVDARMNKYRAGLKLGKGGKNEYTIEEQNVLKDAAKLHNNALVMGQLIDYLEGEENG